MRGRARESRGFCIGACPFQTAHFGLRRSQVLGSTEVGSDLCGAFWFWVLGSEAGFRYQVSGRFWVLGRPVLGDSGGGSGAARR